MVTQAKWMDRTFLVRIPAGVFPCVVERLRGTPARLEELFGGISAAVRTRKAGTEWSIQEHAGHLLDLSELDEARLRDYAAGKNLLSAADAGNRKTFEANHNERATGEILREFRSAREEFVSKLGRLSEAEVIRESEHPRLKIRMTLAEWCHFIAEHDDHHLARMRGMAAAAAPLARSAPPPASPSG